MISLQGDSRIGCHRFTSWDIPNDGFFKGFYHPEYFIGQTVLHRIKKSNGEILHPVIVHGLYWNGIDWEYDVVLPPDHPEWELEDNEFKHLELYDIEPM